MTGTNYIMRFFYLLYYLKETDLTQLRKFRRYAVIKTGKSSNSIQYDMLASVFRYNISLKDYFCFRFFELKKEEKNKWAGTGFMYEYQLIMNPKGARKVLENKISFLKHFQILIKRQFLSIIEMKSDKKSAEVIISCSPDRLVLKGSHGQIGAEVEVIKTDEFTPDSLIHYMESKKYDLAEEYVVQHSSLMELSPSGLNTVRIFTQIHNEEVDILGARLRISVNSPVDNMAAGNLAAPVDIVTGVVSGPAVYSDITKEDMMVHPVTGKTIVGFQVPHWVAIIKLARDAALLTQENKSVGWDIAITEEGPELIEGNHNWCKLLWQMPVKRGLKHELEKYLIESKKLEVSGK